MHYSQSLAFTLAVAMLSLAHAAADEPTPAAAYDRSVPYDFATGSQAASPGRGASDALQIADLEYQLAALRRETAAHRAENVKLKLMLQEYQLQVAAAALPQTPAALKPVFDTRGNVLRSSIWTSRDIAVSWENPGDADPDELRLVREAIQDTWEKHSGVRFTGWGTAQSNSRGIRIRIADAHPHVKRLGRHLDGLRDGMVLNFDFRNWCPQCLDDREGAIRKIAVHEFGHALGFAHEQNRDDAPLWCQQETQGSDGDWYVTIYDPESIMNYCNPEWNNAGRLSPLDIRAAQILYGAPSASAAPPAEGSAGLTGAASAEAPPKHEE